MWRSHCQTHKYQGDDPSQTVLSLIFFFSDSFLHEKGFAWKWEANSTGLKLNAFVLITRGLETKRSYSLLEGKMPKVKEEITFELYLSSFQVIFSFHFLPSRIFVNFIIFKTKFTWKISRADSKIHFLLATYFVWLEHFFLLLKYFERLERH